MIKYLQLSSAGAVSYLLGSMLIKLETKRTFMVIRLMLVMIGMIELVLFDAIAQKNWIIQSNFNTVKKLVDIMMAIFVNGTRYIHLGTIHSILFFHIDRLGQSRPISRGSVTLFVK